MACTTRLAVATEYSGLKMVEMARHKEYAWCCGQAAACRKPIRVREVDGRGTREGSRETSSDGSLLPAQDAKPFSAALPKQMATR